MCRRVTCDECGKPTFAGCGMHVDQVLAGVPEEKRCQGHAPQQKSGDAKQGRPRWWPF